LFFVCLRTLTMMSLLLEMVPPSQPIFFVCLKCAPHLSVPIYIHTHTHTYVTRVIWCRKCFGWRSVGSHLPTHDNDLVYSPPCDKQWVPNLLTYAIECTGNSQGTLWQEYCSEIWEWTHMRLHEESDPPIPSSEVWWCTWMRKQVWKGIGLLSVCHDDDNIVCDGITGEAFVPFHAEWLLLSSDYCKLVECVLLCVRLSIPQPDICAQCRRKWGKGQTYSHNESAFH
jgi:hypothetical protein